MVPNLFDLFRKMRLPSLNMKKLFFVLSAIVAIFLPKATLAFGADFTGYDRQPTGSVVSSQVTFSGFYISNPPPDDCSDQSTFTPSFLRLDTTDGILELPNFGSYYYLDPANVKVNSVLGLLLPQNSGPDCFVAVSAPYPWANDSFEFDIYVAESTPDYAASSSAAILSAGQSILGAFLSSLLPLVVIISALLLTFLAGRWMLENFGGQSWRGNKYVGKPWHGSKTESDLQGAQKYRRAVKKWDRAHKSDPFAQDLIGKP
jgi:hypothetical protein